MALNMRRARNYNNGRGYEFHAKRVIQDQMGMTSGTGRFDDGTIRAVYNWQGSPDRVTTLAQDGMFGPNSLGCMLAEMRRGPMSTDIAHLNPYPHNPPSGTGPGASAVVSSFTISDLVNLDLRADGAGWQLRGRFRVDIRLNESLANPNRYQYRQFIKGTATTTAGRFTGPTPSPTNWEATATPRDRSSQFGVPGGLNATSWSEDGVVAAGGTRKYGYRRSAAFVANGEEDQYLPGQRNGTRYVAVDTYGLMGTRRVAGTKLNLDLSYKGVIVDVLNSDREVSKKTWRYQAERIMT